MKARIRILAMSSSSRQSFAGNQEVYLADLELKGKHEFVKLVDQYPGFGLPLRPSLLHNQQLFDVKVTREPECDVPGSEIYLHSGNAAIYDASVRDTLSTRSADQISCYKTLHQTFKIAKSK